MRTLKHGFVALVTVALALLGGAAAFSGQAPAKGSPEVTTTTTPFNRCTILDYGLDLAIARGPSSGPGHVALVNAEYITLRQEGCLR